MEFVLEELSTAVNYGGKLHGQRTESRDCGGVESDEQQPSCESAVRDARPLTSRGHPHDEESDGRSHRLNKGL